MSAATEVLAADQLLFEALPPETRAAIERVIAAQVNATAEAHWVAGYCAGREETKAKPVTHTPHGTVLALVVPPHFKRPLS